MARKDANDNGEEYVPYWLRVAEDGIQAVRSNKPHMAEHAFQSLITILVDRDERDRNDR